MSRRVLHSKGKSLGKRGQEGCNRSVVAKGLADVGKPVHVSGAEDEAAT